MKRLSELRYAGRVSREDFVPEDLRDQAEIDAPLPIGNGQTISQPSLVDEMTRRLELNDRGRVLEIGTGSGYQAAILAHAAEEVYTIEIIPELAETASERLLKLGYSNVHVKEGDGYHGWPENAPFDAIILTASPEAIPPPLVEQLAEGGRMVYPLGAERESQMLMFARKRNGGLHTEQVTPVRFVPFTRRS